MVSHALYCTCNFVAICQKFSASLWIAQASSQTFYGMKNNVVFTKGDFVLRINVSSQFLQTSFLENLPILLVLLPFHYTWVTRAVISCRAGTSLCCFKTLCFSEKHVPQLSEKLLIPWSKRKDRQERTRWKHQVHTSRQGMAQGPCVTSHVGWNFRKATSSLWSLVFLGQKTNIM